MSDDHSHDSHAGSGKGGNKSSTDNAFKKIEDYLHAKIQRFVAFIFILIATGAALGAIFAGKGWAEYVVLVPAAAGLIAYYSRDYAVAVFAILLIFLVIL